MELAKRIEIEILSLDSIAVYKHMDIGTAKPSVDDRAAVTHHLIDLADPDDEFSVAPYLAIAHDCVGQVLGKGKIPVFVGGTPMFLKAILRGFDPGPPPDWEFRESVEADLHQHGIEALRERVRQVDPLSYHRIDAGDSRRMIRVLEVAKVTGVPLSHRQTQFEQNLSCEDCCVYWMSWPRSELHQRINERVDRMFSAGLVDEVKWLLDRYGTLSRTARMAVGYREVIDGIENDVPVDEQCALVATHTRQLAKRQETWFRSFQEITAVEIKGDRSQMHIVDFLEKDIRERFSLFR